MEQLNEEKKKVENAALADHLSEGDYVIIAKKCVDEGPCISPVKDQYHFSALAVGRVDNGKLGWYGAPNNVWNTAWLAEMVGSALRTLEVVEKGRERDIEDRLGSIYDIINSHRADQTPEEEKN